MDLQSEYHRHEQETLVIRSRAQETHPISEETANIINTNLAELLDIKHPIIQADIDIGSFGNNNLHVAVANAGVCG